MRNLVFDIGNTLSKYAVFVDDELIEFAVLDSLNAAVCEDLIRVNNVDSLIFSAVGTLDPTVVDRANLLLDVVILADYKTELPCKNLYESKETLGFDRIAACIGASIFCENENILVIDAGTAITYDVLNKNNEYIGGLISPGLQMRFKALEHFTAKLPLCDKTEDFPLVGKTTKEAIVAGVQNGLINEIDAYIEQIRFEYTDVHVFLTGGDAIFFDKKLKNSIFVNQNLLLYGLNRILKYNAEK